MAYFLKTRVYRTLIKGCKSTDNEIYTLVVRGMKANFLAKLARIAQEDAQNGESSQDEVVVHVWKNLQRTEFD